jgi:short-subunit dehydrogenase
MNNGNAAWTLITGSSQGLGRAFAEECAGRGMNLVLVALPDSGLNEVSRILERAHGVCVEAVEMDLAAPDAPAALCARLREKGIEIGTLINNAGVGYNGRFGDSTLRENETTIELNVGALVRLTHLLLPSMRCREKAWILNVASLAAYFPMPSMPVYSATKSLVLSFSLVLREELRRSTVGVSVLCPNGIRTNRSSRALIERQGLAGRITCRYPDEVARAGLAGLYRRKSIIVPGIVNRMLRLASGFVPRTLYMRAISRRWGTQTGGSRAVQVAAHSARRAPAPVGA